MIKQRIDAVIETLNRREIFQIIFLSLAVTTIILVVLQHHFLHTFYPELTLLVLAIVGALGYVIANRNKETVGEQLTSYSANKLFTYFFSHKQKQTVQYQQIYQDMLEFRNEAKTILNKECFFDNEFEYVSHLPFAKSFPFTAFICLYVDKENIPFDELIRLDINTA